MNEHTRLIHDIQDMTERPLPDRLELAYSCKEALTETFQEYALRPKSMSIQSQGCPSSVSMSKRSAQRALRRAALALRACRMTESTTYLSKALSQLTKAADRIARFGARVGCLERSDSDAS